VFVGSQLFKNWITDLRCLAGSCWSDFPWTFHSMDRNVLVDQEFVVARYSIASFFLECVPRVLS
jgi:hypothetical protein